MAKILLVEDDQEWLDLIGRSLPEHDVDTASSHAKALRALRDGGAYDVAIVDLNLIDSRGHGTGGDLLGGKILAKLRDEYPATRRIAMTGYPPTSVRRLLDLYRLDDLLLKRDMTFAVVGEVVQAALDRAAAEIPPAVGSRKSMLQKEFRGWREHTAWSLGQRIQRLENDLSGSGFAPVTDDSLKAIAAMRARLAELKARKQDFDRDCAKVEAMIASMRSVEDALDVEQRIEALKGTFGPDDGTGAP
jgi:CheY-like chemotaxis protein